RGGRAAPARGSERPPGGRRAAATSGPQNPALTAGGSSGGAGAALAAGLAPLAEGSDLAGSIRIPSAACGVVGLKPGPGRVARYPAPNGWQTLSVHGPLARTVRHPAPPFRP